MNEEEINSRFEKIERRIDILEGRKIIPNRKDSKIKDNEIWYKNGSTIHKILILIGERFFDDNKTISEIIKELKSKDYHLKASDLTLPLRKIVRRGILKKTKLNSDKSVSRNWMYKKS